MPSQSRLSKRLTGFRQLEQGFTTVMLRRLPADVTVQWVLSLLNEVAHCLYDFVYIPHDRNRQVNIGLAWVNFVDHDTAAKAFQELQSRASSFTSSDSFAGVEVRSANIQGLAANLAYLQARFGFQALHQAKPPLVFEEGKLQNLGQVVKAIVTPQLLQEARELVAAERDGTAMKSRRGGYARRQQGFLWNPVSNSAEATEASDCVYLTSQQVQDDAVQVTFVVDETGHPSGIQRLIFNL